MNYTIEAEKELEIFANKIKVSTKHSSLIKSVENTGKRVLVVLRSGDSYNFPDKDSASTSKKIFNTFAERHSKIKEGDREKYSLGKYFNELKTKY